MNQLEIEDNDFPFHQLFAGSCTQLENWLDQLMDASDPDDFNILFLKVTRIGKFVCVPSKYTWIADQFFYYSSDKHKDWLIIDFAHFFKHNTELFKLYSSKPTH